MLYDENTIEIDMKECVIHLTRVLLPHRIDTIRYMLLHWRERQPTPLDNAIRLENWHNFWSMIASMKGLVALVVQVHITHDQVYDWRHHEARLFEVAKSVTRPLKFEIYLEWGLGALLLENVSRS